MGKSIDSRGIVVPPGNHKHFVCTDNVSGWFDGWTHSRGFGLGYMVTWDFVLSDWSSRCNGNELNRGAKASSQVIFPWGTWIHYPTLEEILVLHSGRRILSLGLIWEGGGEHKVEILPQWLEPWSNGVWKTEGDFSILIPESSSPSPRKGEDDSPQIRNESPFRSYSPPEVSQAPIWIGSWEETTGTSKFLHLCFGQSREELFDNLLYVQTGGVVEKELIHRTSRTQYSQVETGHPEYDKALWWAAQSAYGLVNREFGTGIWAGLPWFKDNWGRDTFIALPGTLLVPGHFDDSKNVLLNFARFQNTDSRTPDFGRIPNRVNRNEILYNTVDGTPWLIRELWEHMQYTGDVGLAKEFEELVATYILGVQEKGFVGTNGLLRHDDADTWMDARIEGQEPWSARGPFAVEIQALWYNVQWVAHQLAKLRGDDKAAQEYLQSAELTRNSFCSLFVRDGILVDRLTADEKPDGCIRPNALMVSMIPFVNTIDPQIMEQTTKYIVQTLLLPYGILSLDPDHPWFHPYHECPSRYHKDAAYHNGSIWGWNAGFTITALCKAGWQDLAWDLTENLAGQILETGTPGTMGELVEPLLLTDGTIIPSGTFSQAWSVSEFVRNFQQDFLGFKPRMVENLLVFEPAIPGAWKSIKCSIPYGIESAGKFLGISIQSEFKSNGCICFSWQIHTRDPNPPALEFTIKSYGIRDDLRLNPTWEGGVARFEYEYFPVPREKLPRFREPLSRSANYPTLQGCDVLFHHIKSIEKVELG